MPGAVAGWLEGHKKHGSLPLETLLQPTIDLAEQGFEVLPFLSRLFTDSYSLLLEDPVTEELMLNDGFPYVEGDIMANPEYAKTLRKIIDEGVAGFYTGEIAQAMVDTSEKHGGWFAMSDLENYQVQRGAPLTRSSRNVAVITASPPPSPLGRARSRVRS